MSRLSDSKRRRQVGHARRRLFTRYGLQLDSNLHTSFIKQIQSGAAKFLEKQSDRVSVFEVIHDGREITVVYDRKRKVIVTALPRDGCDSSPEGLPEDDRSV